MAVRLSTQSGNTHSAPFAFGSAVNNGDLLQITNSAHAATIDQSCTLGTSPCAGYYSRPTVTATGSGGSLPAGAYRVKLVPVSGAGSANSGVPGMDSVQVTITAGQVVRITLPTLIGGSSAWDVYLTNTGGGTGTQHRYATNQSGASFDCSSASWEDGTQTFANAAALPFAHALGYASSLTSHTGGFTVNAGVEVTLKGDVALLGTLTLNAPTVTGGLTFDNAAAPSGTRYGLLFGTVDANGTGKIVMRGSSASRSFIRSASTTNQAYVGTTNLSNGVVSPVRLDVQWGLFSKLGGASVPAVNCNCTATYNQALSDTVFDADCRELAISNVPATGGWILDRVAFRQTAGNTYGGRTCCVAFQQASSSADVTTGTRTVTGCAFEVLPPGISAGGSTYTNCYFNDVWGNLSSGAGGSATSKAAFLENFCRKLLVGAGNGIDSVGISADCTDCYLYLDNVTGPTTTDLNPHGIDVPAQGAGTTKTHLRWTIEYNGSDESGDMFKGPGATAGTVKILNALIVPNANNGSTGTIMTFPNAGNASYQLFVEHCTYIGGPYSLSTSEGGLQTAGMIASCQSNMVFNIPGTTIGRFAIGKAAADGQNDTTDVASPANVGHNAGWNLQDVTGNWVGAYSWYNTKFSSAPGAGDVDLGDSAGADVSTHGPKFVDPSRKFITWCVTVLGATGTNAQKIQKGLDALKAVADTTSPNYVPGLVMTAPATWVRAGFAPQNTLLFGAGHDGFDIGAVQASSGHPARRRLGGFPFALPAGQPGVSVF